MKKILNKIGVIGKEHNIKVYAVGGTVRDILLGKKDFGIDIAVEGDGIKFAELLQKEFGGKCMVHEKFGTASLIISANLCKGKPTTRPYLTIDVASCREEQYPEPTKLPKVRTSTLHKDLKRRDFTINAMALDLTSPQNALQSEIPHSAIPLIDPFGGKKDLADGLIRILHPKSFIDDPTRIFRAMRFAGRLNFKLEPETELLARKAIEDGLIKKLTSKRIRNEIILILKEPERERILELMHKFKLLNQLGLKLPAPNLFKNIDKNLIQHSAFGIQHSEDWFVYLLGIIELNIPMTMTTLPIGLIFTRQERQKIEHTNVMLNSIQQLESAKKPSLIYDLLKGTSAEELLFIASLYSKLKPKILKFSNVYSKVKLRISGKDLIKLGVNKGPLYKKLLTATLYAKLDGKLHTKKEELEFVKTLLNKNKL